MEADGYAFGASNLSAASVGAPHDRERLYFMAHANAQHVTAGTRREHHRPAPRRDARDHLDPVRGAQNFWSEFATLERRRLKPDAQLLVDGFPTRLAQLYAFGNAIVPQVAAQFIVAASEAIGASAARRYQGLDAFDRASQRPAHRPAKSENVHSSGRPSGNSVAALLRRLRTARPDLHARVLAGEISAYAGMIEAGWRTRPSEVGRKRQRIGGENRLCGVAVTRFQVEVKSTNVHCRSTMDGPLALADLVSPAAAEPLRRSQGPAAQHELQMVAAMAEEMKAEYWRRKTAGGEDLAHVKPPSKLPISCGGCSFSVPCCGRSTSFGGRAVRHGVRPMRTILLDYDGYC